MQYFYRATIHVIMKYKCLWFPLFHTIIHFNKAVKIACYEKYLFLPILNPKVFFFFHNLTLGASLDR